MSLDVLTEADRVRRLVAGEASRGELATVLERLAPGAVIGDVELTRCTFKPGRTLRASYAVTVSGRRWPVNVTWRSDDAAASVAEPAAPAPSLAPPPPFARLADRSSALGAQVLVWPFDPAFPAVADLAAHWQRGGATVEVIRYRPGQRHVLRVAAASGERWFLKLAPGHDRATLDAVLAEAEASLPDATRAMLVGPVDLDGPDLGALAIPEVRGAAIGGAGRTPVPTAALEELGELAAGIHRLSPAAGAGLPHRTAAQELALVDRACQHIVALAPELAPIIDEVLAAAGHRPGEPTTGAADDGESSIVHGDLKLDHVIVTDGSIRVIDLDGVRVADPASDLAKLLAELRFLEIDAGRPGCAAAATAVERGYRSGGTDRSDDVIGRAHGLTPALLVKMAARRVTLADPDWRPRVSAVVRAAGRLADAAGRRPTTVAS